MLAVADLRITTLGENTSSGRGLLGEWGLSVLVETGQGAYLLDAGAGSSTASNADALGLELSGVQTIVLSHGHHDHTGGLRALLPRMGGEGVRVVAHPGIWAEKYSRNRETGKVRYAGIPYRRQELESLGARFELSTRPTWLEADVTAGGEEPMSTDFEPVASNLLVRAPEGLVTDTMADDQSLYIRTDRGLVIVLGCAHRGVVNILRHARQLMATERVHMVIGGSHLYSASVEQLDATVAALRQMQVEWLGLSHCTGLKAAVRLSREFQERFFFNNAGTVIRFPFRLPA